MPELPEVEAVRTALEPLVRGTRIERCEVVHPIAVRPQLPGGFIRSVTGRRIRGVRRRGKYLLLEMDRGWLVLHFRLDGQLLWLGRATRPGHDSPHACVRLTLKGRRRGVLGFVDPRHFGRVLYATDLAELRRLRTMGIEPLTPQFTAAVLGDLLRGSRRPLKLLLLDQTRIAGLGNIYSSEALWRARLSPLRRSDRVGVRGARALHKAIVGVLRAALECCLTPPPDFRDPQWWFQGLERILRVYGRGGLKCRRCGSTIRRIMQGGRSTFYCPRCQE
jgi:formamidopyrimidine-DNA glycosylase